MTAMFESMTTRGFFRVVVALTLTLSIVGCATPLRPSIAAMAWTP